MAQAETNNHHPHADNDCLVKVEGASVAIDGRALLEDIDLQVNRSEMLSIVGPNGGGKTTLLKLIIGSLAPTSGKVSRSPGLAIGYQPQRTKIKSHIPISVADVLRTGNKANTGQIGAFMEEFALGASLLDAQIADLSGGERQCVMVIRALLTYPQMLVLDEPGTYCDQQNMARMYDVVERYARKQECAVVIVSHDISRVLAHSDHVYCVNRRIVCAGGPDQIELDEVLGGIDEQKLVTGIYQHRHSHN